MRPPRLSPVGTMSVALTLALAASAAADEVVLIPGSTVKQATGGRVRGTVQSETPAAVVVKLGTTEITVPADQIVSVSYTGQPASLALAEANEASGQLAKAADLYKKAASEAGAKPLIEQAAKYKQAEVTADLAMTDPAKAAEAVALLDRFVKDYPGGRHVAPALETLARLQLQRNDPKVEDTLDRLKKLPAGADRAAVLHAKVLARKGNHDAAIAELDNLMKAAPANSPRRREAQLAKAESLAGMKKFQEAEADLRAAIKALPAEDAASQSAAYNTLGDCLRAAGRPKDALVAYLHTDVLFAKDREQHARALAAISRLWRELKRDDRADEALAKLRQEYPQSPYLTAASANP